MSPSPLRLAPAAVDVERRGDDLVLRCPHPADPPVRALGVLLQRWAERDPQRVLLAERDGEDWRTLSYGEAWHDVPRIGSALLRLGAAPDRPVALLSDNSLAHALLQLGAMHVGVPVAPVSPAYSLMSTTFERLRVVIDTLRPAVVFAEDLRRHAAALSTLPPEIAVVGQGELPRPTTPLNALLTAAPSDAMRQAWAAVGPDTVGKILFTSGSTGVPKGVVNTQRMMCSNQEAIAALWPFLQDTPPVTVDWLPWSHTFGSNHNLGLVLRHGGTLYIDGGRPAPGRIEQTVRNLREISPTIYFNVPRGYDLLADWIERDPALRRSFFARLDVLFYAAAALPPALRERLRRLAAAEGREVFFASAWGSTETAPLATSAYFPTTTPAVIGLPAPGVEIKLAAVEGRHELRVRGPNVTPGTWSPGGRIQPPHLDDEGFLCTGDAGRLVDEADPTRGLLFEGRLGENFKLSTGTWVLVGKLRVALIDACAPWVHDVVIAGRDRDELTALLFVSPPDDETSAAQLRASVAEALRRWNAQHPASSTAIRRALLQVEPPSLDAGETTDKGYLNQRRILEHRADAVACLYAEPRGGDVIVVPR
ncbi:MAG: feruloyl-CoA synthase [Myxococcales bacterium]|nr:feruloyl-CoA synthase [Myxococcales bacterium]